MANAAEHGLVWIRHWRGAVSGVVCQIWIVGVVHFSLVPHAKFLRTPNRSGLDLKSMINRALHKVVLEESGFRVYCAVVD